VVTHNRAALLRECLEAVVSQTRPADQVLVLDNASTDETPEVLASFGDAVDVLRLDRNEGSSGGFHEGMAEAVRRGVDWLWVMDDDTIPQPPALERLLAARDRLDGLPDPVILASKVLWTDGRVHPMNPPWPNPGDINVYLEALERGVVPIRANTFPSMLIRRDAVERHGPPRKGFWIWADDMDFTLRILRDEPGYVVPESVAIHKTKVAHYPWDGGERFYYAVRNGLFILRGETLRPREKLRWGLMVVGQIRRFFGVEGLRLSALKIVARGLRDGVVKPRP
jgi:rhamnopyranosyl-N-acetylglucosaminyl-diphospho-decaprenol beta-1,3/1,4-galactofuranosyltransferase